MPLPMHYNVYNKKETKASVEKDEEKLELSHIAGRDGKWSNHFGKHLFQFLRKLPHDPAIPHLYIYPPPWKYVHKRLLNEYS